MFWTNLRFRKKLWNYVLQYIYTLLLCQFLKSSKIWLKQNSTFEIFKNPRNFLFLNLRNFCIKSAKFFFYNDTKKTCLQLKEKMGVKPSKLNSPKKWLSRNLINLFSCWVRSGKSIKNLLHMYLSIPLTCNKN